MIIGLATPDLQAPNVQAQQEDGWAKLVCDTPDAPSLSMGTSSGNKDNYRLKSVSVSGTYGAKVRTVAERGGEVFCNSSWDSASIRITASEGSTQKIYARWDDVSLHGHYIDYDFEWTREPRPTETPTPTPTSPPPTDTPTPEPTHCGPHCDPTITPRPTKTKGPTVTFEPCGPHCDPTPEPAETPEPEATNTPTPRPNPNPGPSRPIAPTGFKALANSTVFTAIRDSKGKKTGKERGQITMELKWNTVSGNGVTYDVLRDVGGDDPWQVVAPGISRTDVLIRKLEPETKYTYGVRANRSDRTSDIRRLTFETPIPFLGRQRDHVVRYRVRNLVTQGDEGLPPQSQFVPDHAEAIETAVTAWNNTRAATDPDGPQINICESVLCGVSNRDGTEVQIIYPTGAARGIDSVGNDCGASTACFDHGNNNGIGEDGLIPSAKLAIEEPAWEAGGYVADPVHTRIVWTNELFLHGVDVENKHENEYDWRYRYLPSVLMHEFGHALGLADLYKLSYRAFHGYLMQYTIAWKSIPSRDNSYLESVYRNHEPR